MMVKHHINTLVRFYTQGQQQQVFLNYLLESRSIGLTYKAYKALARVGAGHFVLAARGVRSVAQYYPKSTLVGVLIAFAASPNQRRGIENIANLSGGVVDPVLVRENTSKIGRILSLASFSARIFKSGGLDDFTRILHIIKRTEIRYGWVVALNVAMYLFNYLAFRHAFSPATQIVFTANDFSPLPLAFKAAANANGLRQMFTMHGQISCAESGNLFPGLDYDISFLYGQESLRAYVAGGGGPKGRVLFTGFPGESAELRHIEDRISTIGVALPNYYDADTQKAIERISEIYKGAKVFVRYHPHMAGRSSTFPNFPNIEVSRHSSLHDFSRECDIVIAGNTGAQIDIIKFGCPVLYSGVFDKLGVDDIGLVRTGTILEQKDDAIDLSVINQFFNDAWIEKFRLYDALYLANDADMKRVRDEIVFYYNELLGARSLR